MLEASGDRLIDVRNRALLAVAYDGMLRRAELTSIEVRDFLVEMRGDATLLVRRSKTDDEGEGDTLYIARDTVKLVRAWLDGSGITDGRLFRSVGKGGKIGERLDASQVPRIFKGMAQRAGLAGAPLGQLARWEPTTTAEAPDFGADTRSQWPQFETAPAL